ncbi:kinase-like protein [Pseudovirgaria hyperparasitica]|uniref:Kinase-like protein n=1 Tax=Pseudovirgaria hyperparasitica TaxID=470096 RepID=A0A6A6VSK2_9PEZI|nr:kinase-like protein [Pseudovirgaria hyperparasitica]KAF2753648.1 kinase-like protein [Pseudovirgaria hyperparasitica]
MASGFLDRCISRLLHSRTSIAKKICGTLGPNVVRVGRHRLVKGPCHEAELEALQFVARSTSIPIPRVHRTYKYKDRLYIEMEYVQGQTLAAIIEELANFVGQLRGLKPPQDGIVASAESHSCLDYRIGNRPVGPFSTYDEFHAFLRGNIPFDSSEQIFGQQVSKCHSRSYRTLFSHSDLAQRNIIVKDGRIVAIIDWAFSGWYPEYWEYTKAHYGMMNVPDWYSEFERVMPKYDDELKAEYLLWALYEEPGNQKHWRVPGPEGAVVQ